MFSYKLRKLNSIFTASGGCGCGPKATDIIQPIQKPKPPFPDQKPTHYRSSSNTSSDRHSGGKSIVAASDDDYTSTIFSRCSPEGTKYSKQVSAAAWPKIHDSLAVVKDSDDPYQDFRQSMLQMIFDKEIYSSNDLQQLLDCFLQLNSPLHHETIVRAFMEIWNGCRQRQRGGACSSVDTCENTLGAAAGGHVKTLNFV